MTKAPPVPPPGGVEEAMGTRRRPFPPGRPKVLRRSPRRRPSSVQVRETLEGLLEVLGDREAEAIVYEDGEPVPYAFPSDEFRARGLSEGDAFAIDVLQDGDAVRGRIRPAPAPAHAERASPERYLTPDEIEAQSDAW